MFSTTPTPYQKQVASPSPPAWTALYYVHSDHLGSTVAVSDAAGQGSLP